MRCEKCAETNDQATLRLTVITEATTGKLFPMPYQDSDGRTHVHDERKTWRVYRCPYDGTHDLRIRQPVACWCGWEQPE